MRIDDQLLIEPSIQTIVEEKHPKDTRYTTAKVGDVYVCGRHRLVIGDSGNEEILTKALNNRKADLLLTDPPYGVDIEYIDKSRERVMTTHNARVSEGTRIDVANDNLTTLDFNSFIQVTFKSIFLYVKSGGVFYIFYGDNGPSRLAIPEALKHCNATIAATLVWVKDALLFGFSNYKWKHEPVYYGWTDGAPHQWYGEINKNTRVELETLKHLNLNALTRPKLIKVLIKLLELGEPPSSIIRCDKPYRSTLHPTQKPIPLFK